MIFADFQLDSNNDLNIENGDFVVAPSDMQHISDIMDFFPGALKQYPSLGVGLRQYLKSQSPAQVVTVIKQQLQSDGYVVGNINATNVAGDLKVVFPNGSIQRNG